MTWKNRSLLVSLTVFAAACADTGVPTQPPAASGPSTDRTMVRPAQQAPSPNLVDVILEINGQTGEFSTVIQALTAANLVEVLAAVGDKTVFAPTDAAFAALGLTPANVGTLPTGMLTQLLLFHVAPGRLDAATVVGSQSIQMANGRSAQVRIEGDDVFLNNARIVQVDVEATNGIIHVIDAVLLRPAESPTIVDVLLDTYAQTGEFSTLIAAVVSADLVGPLSSRGNGTVFAPTNQAFADIGLNASNVGDIPREQLINILGYHIAPGRRDAASVVQLDRLRMSNGQFANIRVEGGEVFINNARIIATDVPATNSIIHVIDAVLLP
jgi:transforming growth factor-beta-induced protein